MGNASFPRDYKVFPREGKVVIMLGMTYAPWGKHACPKEFKCSPHMKS